ncbi:hypothetical protein [Solirubrobacter soli]|uniref:hypothetical protein n=1 Tax=Solirubrobacter soli TaxID=363832 RepID=UPI00146DC0D5|nr:hypothetical protein [Solirubrobacter soli]
MIAVLAAVVVAAGVLGIVNRDPEPEAAAAPHVAIAPGASSSRADGTVAGTKMSPQQAADAAVEDGKHPDLVPLPEAAFARPIARYRAYAVGQARALIREADALRAGSSRVAARRASDALRAGSSRAAARRAADAAFDRWLLVGAAYGALGDLDARVTGALATLLRDPLDARAARSLAVAAHALPAALRHADLAPVDYAIRAHEILEDVQRDRLGDATGVRATADGVAATREVISTLHGVLAGRGDVLQTVDSRLTQLSATLTVIRRERGAWPAPSALPRAQRQRLLGQLGAALEALAGVPGALETSLPASIPALR